MLKNNHKKTRVDKIYPDPDLPPLKEDFRKTFQWRIFRIMAEFIDGYHFLADFKKTVTFFGSAVFSKDDPYCQQAQKLAHLLAKEGYTVITGGGPGIMEAANRGAFEAGGDSIGINIQLPREQRINKYVNKSIGFNYFFTRKVMLSFSSEVYLFFPGGFGTLDEFFEMITLIQTKKLAKPIPIIAIGRDYWQPLFDWLKSGVYTKYQAIKKEDLNIFQLVDSEEEAFELIKGLKQKK